MDLGNQCKGGTIVRLQGKKLTVQKNPVGDKASSCLFYEVFFYHKDNMIAIVH